MECGISDAVPVFPPVVPVTVVVDGRPIAGYARAYDERGRVYAPIRPLLVELADRVWYENGELVIERDGRRVRVALPAALLETLDETYFEVAPVARALGEDVTYAAHRLEIRRASAVTATPTPYAPASPAGEPRTVFTPEPVPTPRPVWTGSPIPRRTPLPLPPPKA